MELKNIGEKQQNIQKYVILLINLIITYISLVFIMYCIFFFYGLFIWVASYLFYQKMSNEDYL